MSLGFPIMGPHPTQVPLPGQAGLHDNAPIVPRDQLPRGAVRVLGPILLRWCPRGPCPWAQSLGGTDSSFGKGAGPPPARNPSPRCSRHTGLVSRNEFGFLARAPDLAPSGKRERRTPASPSCWAQGALSSSGRVIIGSHGQLGPWQSSAAIGSSITPTNGTEG